MAKAVLSIGDYEKTAAIATSDPLTLRLMMHPDLRMSLSDARQLSLRELVMLQAALDLIDYKKREAQAEMESKMNSIRKR